MTTLPLAFAYQGQEGSYSDQALTQWLDLHAIQATKQPCFYFQELFETITHETCWGFIPIQNTTTGVVTQAQDLFLDFPQLTIIGQHVMNIDHCLLGTGTLESIKRVYSHPQALDQCKVFLDNHHIQAIPYHDTAGSAQYVAELNDPSIGSIASSLCSNLYNLPIVAQGLQHKPHNTTRFLVVKNKSARHDFEQSLPKQTYISVCFETKDIPSALYKCLGGFATNGINLQRLESRPHPTKPFHYLFFLDCIASKESDGYRNALEELSFFSHNILILGEY